MRHPTLDTLARVLVQFSNEVKPGEVCAIRADPIAMPLVLALTSEILRAGAHPVYCARSDELTDLILAEASDAQLAFTSPMDLHRVENTDVDFAIWADRNTRAAGTVDPARQAAASRARRPILEAFMKREAAGQLRWCGTLFPTEGLAQEAEMSLAAYEKFVFEAGLLYLPDPVAAWQQVQERQARLCERLAGVQELHFQVPPHDGPAGANDGTDLRVDVSRGIWINCYGTDNFPDGEVFTGPSGAEGHVNFSFPAVEGGREVDGVRLQFKDGRVTDATATKNEPFLHAMLDLDEGARNIGEIAIGTNYAIKRHTRNTLFDEKIGGTFHLAVGAGYPESGNHNVSALHWDMVCDLRKHTHNPGGTIKADGQLIVENGRVLLDGWPQPLK
jgi:aminopeptidase